MAEIRTQDTYNPNQTVEPNTGIPEDYLHVNANPNVFGGQVAEATEKTGAQLQEIGQTTAETALQYQQWRNELTANDAVQKYAQFASDSEMTLRSKQGQNAIDAYKPFQKGLQDQLSVMASQIQSPAARLAFMNDARSFFDRSQYSAGLYVGDETKKALSESYQGRIKANIDFATLHFDDPIALRDSMNKTVSSSLAIAQNLGIKDKDAVNAMVSQNVGDLVQSVITAQSGQGTTLQQQEASLKKSEALFQQFKGTSIPGSPGVPILDAKHQDELLTHLQYRDLLLSSKQDRAEETAAVATRTAIVNQYSNATAMVERGLSVSDAQLPTQAQIHAAYSKDPEREKEFSDTIDMIKSQSYYNSVLPGATPTQVARLEQEARPDPNNPGTFAKQARLSTALDSSLNARNRAIKSDAAGYIIQSNPQIGQLFQISQQDPAQFGHYANAVTTQQDTMQIPIADRRLLPASVASDYAQKIQGDPKSAPAQLVKLQQQYGYYWPQVYRDIVQSGKLPIEYQAVATLSEEDGITLSKVLSQNTAGGKAITDLLPEKTPAALKSNIDGNQDVNDFIQSRKLTGDSPQQADALKRSIISLAEGNMYFKGMSLHQAKDAAISAFTSNHQYFGHARIPLDKFDTVTQNATYVLNNLNAGKITIPSIVGQPGTTSIQEYINALKDTPTWFTSPQGDSIQLMDMGGKIVRDQRGNPLSIPFNAMPMTPPTSIEEYMGSLQSGGGE